jgi:hypothetical protein
MAMKMQSAVVVLAVAAGMFLAAPRADAVVVYDSGGFEAPRFIAGDLAGQDVQGPWLRSGGTAPAVVQSTVTRSGGQAVQFTRTATGGDTWYGVNKEMTPTAPNQVVRISWDMNVTQTQGDEFGPFFGVDAYDGFGGLPKRVGLLGVDASTGEVLILGAGPTDEEELFVAPGEIVPFGQWNRYALELDYATRTYRGYVNGVLVGGDDFIDDEDGIVGFTDAPIGSLQAGAADVPGVAYFDNYTIEVVPEPTTVAIFGLASLGLLARRRVAR